MVIHQLPFGYAFESPGDRHDPRPPRAVEVLLRDGRIELDTVDTSVTDIELVGRDEAELEQLARIEMRERDGSYEVLVDVADDRGSVFKLLSRDEYRLRVSLPKGSDVRVESGSADVRARGVYGAVRVESGSGDVAGERAAGY